MRTQTNTVLSITILLGLMACEKGEGSGPATPNGVPTAPVVSISPQVPTSADSLEVVIGQPSTDPDKEAVSYIYKWSLDGLVQTALNTAIVPAAQTVKGQRWEVKVRGTDGKDESSPATAVTMIINSVPSISVRIEPENPTSSEDITVIVDSADADGDDISLRYSWRVDAAVSTRTAATIPNSDTSLNQVWTVTVTASDGESESAPATAVVKIGNAAPTIDEVRIQPDPATSADQLFASTGMVVDRDGDPVVLNFDWQANGVSIQNTSERTLPPGTAQRGQSVTVTVTPNDGFVDGMSVTSTAVVLGNAAPELAQVVLTPAAGSISTTFLCDASAAIDYDQDALVFSYQWFVNASAVTQTSSLAAPFFTRGDSIYCEASVSDGMASTATVRSPSITVGNAAPSITTVSIGPAMPTEADTLVATVTGYSDPENDPEGNLYSWLVNGRQVATSTSINGAVFNRGDRITLAVTPHDGMSGGAAISSNALTVLNAVPSIASVEIAPTPAGTLDNLTASPLGYADLDPGDSRQFAFVWSVDGAALPLTIGVLDSSYFSRGSTVSVSVTPSDGMSTGAAVSSPLLIISNTRPTTPTIHIEPTVPDESMDLTCTMDAVSTDADNDPISYSYSWLVDGNPNTHTSSVVVASMTTAGEVWTCQVAPHDGFETGLAASVNAYVTARCDAVEFDGASDYAHAGHDGILNYGSGATIEAWVKWDGNLSAGFDQAVFTHRPESNAMSIGIFGQDTSACACPGRAAGQAYFRWGDSCGSDTCLSAASLFPSNAWVHVAGVYSGGQATIYVNGVAAATTTSAAAIESIVGTSSVGIAAQSDGSGSFFGGQISEVRLSTSAIYLADFSPNTGLESLATTVAHWKINEASGSTLADVSNSGHDAVLASGLWVVSGPACLLDVIDISTRYANALCQFRTRCEPVYYPYLGSDEASCISERTSTFASLYSGYLPMLAENRLNFESTVLDSCINSLNTVSCHLGLDLNACNFFVGQQTVGQPCGVTNECVDAAYCPVGSQFGSCAACTARTANGVDCASSVCQDGSRCLTVGSARLCISFQATTGGTCGTVASGLCRGRLQCVGPVSRKRCFVPAGLGGVCDTQLARSANCNIYENHTCVTGRCATASWSGAGGSCAGNGQCDETASCNVNTQLCEALPSAGQACLSGRCAPDHYCDGQICQADIVVGSACTGTTQCQPNRYCINSSCEEYSWTQCN